MNIFFSNYYVKESAFEKKSSKKVKFLLLVK